MIHGFLCWLGSGEDSEAPRQNMMNSATNSSHISVLEIVSTLHLRPNHPPATATRKLPLNSKENMSYSNRITPLHNCWKYSSVHKISKTWIMTWLNTIPRASSTSRSRLITIRILFRIRVFWLISLLISLSFVVFSFGVFSLTHIHCASLRCFLSNSYS
jgi:hypothetical protein